MSRFVLTFCIGAVLFGAGCKLGSPPEEEAAPVGESAEPAIPTMPRTGWEPKERHYPLSPVSVAKAEDVVEAAADGDMPNILVIWGDDIGQSNISAYTMGLMGFRTPNIDRVAKEGMIFTDYYGEQSCTAGRSTFITGQSVFRTGLSKVGMPGADMGLSGQDPTIAQLLKQRGYATGQFGKNHLGDKDEHLPTNHGFDEFLGNLYHLNAEEEPENVDYPKNPQFLGNALDPRGVIHSYAPTARIEDTGALTKKRMEVIDDETSDAAMRFMEEQVQAGKKFFVWWNGTRMHFRTHVKDPS